MATHYAGVSRPCRHVPGEVRVLGGGDGRPALDAGAEAVAGALVEGPVADHDVGHTAGDGHGRLVHGGARRAAAVVDAAEKREVADAQGAGHVDLGIGVGREGDHAIDLGRLDAGVPQRRGDRLGGEAQLARARVLGELGGADPGDGGPAGEARTR